MENRICSCCGVIIGKFLKPKCNENRNICKVCRKQQVNENYSFKKDIYNQRRRDKYIKKPKVINNCIICLKDFETNRKDSKTCGCESCQKEYKLIYDRLMSRKKSKKVTLNKTFQ